MNTDPGPEAEISRLQERVDEEHAQVAQMSLALQDALQITHERMGEAINRIDRLEQEVWELRQVGGAGAVLDTRREAADKEDLRSVLSQILSAIESEIEDCKQRGEAGNAVFVKRETYATALRDVMFERELYGRVGGLKWVMGLVMTHEPRLKSSS